MRSRGVGGICSVAVVGVVVNSEASTTYSHELTDLARKLDQLEAEAREEDDEEHRQKLGVSEDHNVETVNKSAEEDFSVFMKENYAWKIRNFTADFGGRSQACEHRFDASNNRIDEIKDCSNSPEGYTIKGFDRMPLTSTPGINGIIISEVEPRSM